MNFSKALKKLKKGKTLTRDYWEGQSLLRLSCFKWISINDPTYNWTNKGDTSILSVYQIRIYTALTGCSCEYKQYIPTECDILADDWKVIKK